ncbi:hypothetical protein ABH930_000243 [Kitasatospora sp. GAS204A]|uniref:hypothetical protein n=1 Tax=unclassified Kitasatospora TaxID=2633591 RepID=UPI0024765999|nr:hypothetical protein [Kitasatospora sp. GAS204B]MDH6116824.1 hypothetical protein [Kitasatospora sp. GAS204B]
MSGSVDQTVDAARAVALAHALPRLKEYGRRAAGELEGLLGRAALGEADLARLLAEAETMTRLVTTGDASLAQEHAAKLAREAIDALPAGRLSADLAERAVLAAGAVARVRRIVQELNGPEHAARVAELLATGGVLDEVAVRRARSAAMARGGAAALDERGAELEQAVELMVRQLAETAVDEVAARAGTRRRLAAARRGRERRAAELTGRLLARVRRGPAVGDRPTVPTDPQLLDWLRGLTHPALHLPECEDVKAAWLGADPFGLRELPPPPPFLAGLDLDSLPPEHLAPLLRRLSMIRPAPTAAELTPAALDLDPGPVSESARTAELRRWGQPADSGAPPLPELTRIPRVVHGIWLGKPMPRTTVFRENYARAARRYAGQVDFVLWTDVPRELFDAARAEPGPVEPCPVEPARAEPVPRRGRNDPLAAVRSLLDWATGNGIHLVNIFEVFHAEAPMKLRAPFVLEMSKQLARGYASASDHLRVDIIERLGGAYADGDVVLVGADAESEPEERLPDFFDRVAGSLLGFTMNPLPGEGVCNDILVAPAHHPAIALWAECARLNYSRTQADVFGGVQAMARPYVGHDDQDLRQIAPCRSGRIHHDVLRLLGLQGDDLPPTDPARIYGSEGSWCRPLPADAAGAGPRQPSADEVTEVLARCLTFLEWQLLAREGDLYLAAVDPVIRALPDPDAAWTALLRVLPTAAGPWQAVASVTDARRGDDGTAERVDLPPEAELLLDREACPEHRWIGSQLPVPEVPARLLDEFVSPAVLREPDEPLPAYLDRLAPLTEVAVDPLGQAIGLWLRTPQTTGLWRHEGRFAAVPPGHLRISLGLVPGLDWTEQLGVRPEGLALLVLAVGAAGRPVDLVVPAGSAAAIRDFARRLERYLGVPVRLVRAGPGALAPPPKVRPLVPPVGYLPLPTSNQRVRASRSPG